MKLMTIVKDLGCFNEIHDGCIMSIIMMMVMDVQTFYDCAARDGRENLPRPTCCILC